jgi:hypothetical protein
MTGRRTVPTITLAKRLPRDGKKAYDAIVKASEDSCGPDEYWVINGPEGPLSLTASKQFHQPIVMFCDAAKCDWDEATEAGFFLDRMTIVKALEGK